MSFDENYFSTHTYENITFAKYSMYWWSNRFYVTLATKKPIHKEHLDGCDALLELCREPRRALDTFPALFKSRISDSNLIMATGEAVAHLNYLINEGQMEVEPDADGAGGVDLALVQPAWLRRQVGVVMQENFLFNRSVRENIALGKPGATDADVRAAMDAAEIDAFEILRILRADTNLVSIPVLLVTDEGAAREIIEQIQNLEEY